MSLSLKFQFYGMRPLHAIQIKKSQQKHPWCKKSCGQESKKGCAEKDVKSKWVAKTSCC